MFGSHRSPRGDSLIYDSENDPATKLDYHKLFRLLILCMTLTGFCFVLMLFMWNWWTPPAQDQNVLAVSLTIIEIMLAILAIFLGVIAFGGFWIIRREAIGAAQDAAKSEVQRLLLNEDIQVGEGKAPRTGVMSQFEFCS